MLRGINVGGNRGVKMEDLKRLYTSLGYQNVRTYVQSGNVVFEHHDANSSKLAGEIEKSLKQHFGFDISVVIRTDKELKRLIDKNPFTEKDESKMHVTFLSTKPRTFSTDQIDGFVASGEAFLISGQDIYLFCPNGYGRTKLSNNFFEKTLKVIATTRNWRTTKTLYSMTSGA